jgi:hypothetical protein
MFGVIIKVAAAANVTINTNIPGASPSDSIQGVISNFYSFALIIAGILAFGAVVWGGIKYATGRGNPTAESEGKSWITNALLGLLLLGGAWIVLYTVNPNLVSLTDPSKGLPGLEAVSNSSNGNQSCGGTTYGSCATGSSCLKKDDGTYYCQPDNGTSKNPNPVCKGVAPGCNVWDPKRPTPNGCVGYGGHYTCITGGPPSHPECYNQVTC